MRRLLPAVVILSLLRRVFEVLLPPGSRGHLVWEGAVAVRCDEIRNGLVLLVVLLAGLQVAGSGGHVEKAVDAHCCSPVLQALFERCGYLCSLGAFVPVVAESAGDQLPKLGRTLLA